MFFVVSGAALDISIIPKSGYRRGLSHIQVLSKVSDFGAVIMNLHNTKKYRSDPIPQAGVAIGLSLIAANTLPGYGSTIRTVVLCATLIYELTGPAITKIGLKRPGKSRNSQKSVITTDFC